MHHVSGSADLIRHRSPSNFTTPFEQELFLAHIGPAISESFYRCEPCYLAQPEWMRLYESLAHETPDLANRSPLVIRIRKALLKSAGIILDTSRAMSTEGQCDPGFLLALELKVRENHQHILECVAEYRIHGLQKISSIPPKSTSDIGREAFGSALECLCVYKRALAALSETDRLRLETECQALASLIIGRHEQPSLRQSWVYTNLEQGVALAVQGTRSSWEEDVTGDSALEQKLAARRRWQGFRVHIMGIEAMKQNYWQWIDESTNQGKS